MENVTRAFIMAFSMLIFVIGFSFSMYLINKLVLTSNTLLSSVGTTKYYDSVKIKKSDDPTKTRYVGPDAIVSTLYRYYKENYEVKIYKKDGTLLQVFDTNIEGKIANAASAKNPTYEQKKLNESFNNKSLPTYLFEAPWTGSTSEATRMRIDYFLNGSKGYINNTLVDYSRGSSAFPNTDGGFLKNSKDKTFEESFVEYAYTGETISVTDEKGEQLRSRNYNRKF